MKSGDNDKKVYHITGNWTRECKKAW